LREIASTSWPSWRRWRINLKSALWLNRNFIGPHRICPQLTSRTPARTHISHPSLLFRLTLNLWYVGAVVCGGRVLPLRWQAPYGGLRGNPMRSDEKDSVLDSCIVLYKHYPPLPLAPACLPMPPAVFYVTILRYCDVAISDIISTLKASRKNWRNFWR
jgi:hypothetical protein